MIVCICDNINNKTLHQIIKDNKIRKIKQIQAHGVCTKCKKCCSEIKKIIHESTTLV